MEQETMTVDYNDSSISNIGKIIVTNRGQSNPGNHEITVGSPGLPNLYKSMELGETVIFETVTDGMFEIRALSYNEEYGLKFLVTRISPHLSFTAGFTTDDPNNLSFSNEEIERINLSLESVKISICEHGNLAKEKIELFDRKINEIAYAATRLGRKDWLTYTAGALTSLCISAAFAPETTKLIFRNMSIALSWLFQNSLNFIQ